MDTKTPDSAGLVCFKADTDQLQKRSGIEDGRLASPGMQPPQLSGERRGQMTTGGTSARLS